MPIPPSDATLLRGARSQLKIETARAAKAEKDRDAYREKLAEVQKECAEWKERFDLLLRARCDADSATERKA